MPPYGPWYGWEIFPVIGLIFMVVMMFFMFGPNGPFGSRRSGSGTDGQAERGPERPLDLLKRRYATGEITKEQYEEMRRDLLA